MSSDAMERSKQLRSVQRQRFRTGAAISLGTIAALLIFAFLPIVLHPPLSRSELGKVDDPRVRIELRQAQDKQRSDTRSTLLQAMASLLLVAGAYATWRQVQITREGQITDRFTRAVDQVGSDNLDVRIGGIFALGRISVNSPSDRSAVQHMLCAYMRGHSPWAAGSPGGPLHPSQQVESVPWLQNRGPDIQAALGVLAQRPDPGIANIYLSRTDLRVSHIVDGMLSDSNFRHSNLARAWLSGTCFDGSDMTDVDLREAHLCGASFVGVNLAGAFLRDADVTGATFAGANIRGADMRVLNFESATFSGATSDQHTVWPAHVDAAIRRDRGILE
jgi:hypothetical protein